MFQMHYAQDGDPFVRGKNPVWLPIGAVVVRSIVVESVARTIHFVLQCKCGDCEEGVIAGPMVEFRIIFCKMGCMV